jgi:hypothetical protein
MVSWDDVNVQVGHGLSGSHDLVYADVVAVRPVRGLQQIHCTIEPIEECNFLRARRRAPTLPT